MFAMISHSMICIISAVRTFREGGGGDGGKGDGGGDGGGDGSEGGGGDGGGSEGGGGSDVGEGGGVGGKTVGKGERLRIEIRSRRVDRQTIA